MYTQSLREQQVEQIRHLLGGVPKTHKQLARKLGIHEGIVLIRLEEINQRGQLQIHPSVSCERLQVTSRKYSLKRG